MADHEDCNCVSCYLDKRVAFEEGKPVTIGGFEVKGFFDASIVIENGERRAALGIRPSMKVRDLLLIAQAYLSAASDLVGEEFTLSEVNSEDRN